MPIVVNNLILDVSHCVCNVCRQCNYACFVWGCRRSVAENMHVAFTSVTDRVYRWAHTDTSGIAEREYACSVCYYIVEPVCPAKAVSQDGGLITSTKIIFYPCICLWKRSFKMSGRSWQRLHKTGSIVQMVCIHNLQSSEVSADRYMLQSDNSDSIVSRLGKASAFKLRLDKYTGTLRFSICNVWKKVLSIRSRMSR